MTQECRHFKGWSVKVSSSGQLNTGNYSQTRKVCFSKAVSWQSRGWDCYWGELSMAYSIGPENQSCIGTLQSAGVTWCDRTSPKRMARSSPTRCAGSPCTR